MELFNTSIFKKLAEVHSPHCISIYIPTHTAGPEGIKQDKLQFKNQLKQAAEKVRLFGLTKDQADSYLEPARELLEDEYIWSHMSDGLMLFLFDETVEYFRVPVSFTAQCHVEPHLYLLPAIPLLSGAARHFILTVSLGKVRLLEASRHAITEMELPDSFPAGLKDVVGKDYEQASLQFRSGHGEAPGAAIYHGQGAGAMTEKKTEILRYFNDIDKQVNNLLQGENCPLVIACVDYLFPIYQEKNSYGALSSKFIAGNHDRTAPDELKAEAWKIVGDDFNQDREKELEKFEDKLGSATASFNQKEVIPAGIVGQAETLFVKEGAEIWGTYDPETHEVELDEFQRTGNAELVNQAAVETVKHGGKVLYLENDEMPEEMGDIAASYRYTL